MTSTTSEKGARAAWVVDYDYHGTSIYGLRSPGLPDLVEDAVCLRIPPALA